MVKILRERDDLSQLCQNYIAHLATPKFETHEPKPPVKPRSIYSLLRTGNKLILGEVEQRLSLGNIRGPESEYSIDLVARSFDKDSFQKLTRVTTLDDRQSPNVPIYNSLARLYDLYHPTALKRLIEIGIKVGCVGQQLSTTFVYFVSQPFSYR